MSFGPIGFNRTAFIENAPLPPVRLGFISNDGPDQVAFTRTALPDFRSSHREFKKIVKTLGELHDRKEELKYFKRRGQAPPAHYPDTPGSAEQKYQANLLRAGAVIADMRATRQNLTRVLRPSEMALLAYIEREYLAKRNITAEQAAVLGTAKTKAYKAWEAVRKSGRTSGQFQLVRSELENLVETARRYGQALKQPGQASVYEAFLNLNNPGLTEAKLDALVNELKPQLIGILKTLRERGAKPLSPDVGLSEPIMRHDQARLIHRLVRDLGFDFRRGQVITAPKAVQLYLKKPSDIRVLRRLVDNFYVSLGSTVHEVGHGIFAQGVDPRIGEGPGLPCRSLDESQSRLFQTMVAQSRPFWRKYAPLVREAFPCPIPEAVYDNATLAEQIYRFQNRVQLHDSRIRINADEVTYNLHVIVRYEIERDLINGKLQVKDIPRLWNAKMKEYLNVEPSEDDYKGCLQDPHWFNASFGIFPSYLMGNLMAAQLFEQAMNDPNVRQHFEAGEYKPLRQWLRKHIHRDNFLRTGHEVISAVTGQDISAQPFIRYLQSKYGDLYGVNLDNAGKAQALMPQTAMYGQ